MNVPEGRRAHRPDEVDRRRSRRFDPVLLLSLLIPLLTVAVLATVNPASTTEVGRAPTAAPLGAAVLVCPAALAGADQVAAAVGDPAVSGALQVAGADDLVVRPGAVATRRTGASVVVRGRDAMASGLLAARGGAGAGTDCRSPESDVWFAGVGAGPEHASMLHLANPDGGPALADVTVLAADGLREVGRLRGVAVEPRGEVELDLAALMPERDDASIRVTVNRGRLASWIVDRVEPLGGDERAQAWLPPAAAPGTDLVLPGVGRGAGDRVLVLANDGAAQALVEVRAVTAESEFVPSDLPQVQVAPGASATVDLSRFLRSAAAQDVVGLRLASSEPVTGLVRSRSGDRMTHAVATTPVTSRGAVLVDVGAKRLVFAGAAEKTEVQVLQRGADGEVLREGRAEVLPDRGTLLPLVAKARYVEVVVGDHPVSAAVESLGGSLPWVRPVRELVTDTWVPHVGPALY